MLCNIADATEVSSDVVAVERFTDVIVSLLLKTPHKVRGFLKGERRWLFLVSQLSKFLFDYFDTLFFDDVYLVLR